PSDRINGVGHKCYGRGEPVAELCWPRPGRTRQVTPRGRSDRSTDDDTVIEACSSCSCERFAAQEFIQRGKERARLFQPGEEPSICESEKTGFTETLCQFASHEVRLGIAIGPNDKHRSEDGPRVSTKIVVRAERSAGE